MHPVKIVIPGQFWDSHLYSSRLYLFGFDSSVATIDWMRLIHSIQVQDNLKFALQCAFTNSEWLYGPKFRILFKDQEIRNLIESKFLRLSNLDLIISKGDIASAREKYQDFHHPFPFSDLSIYKNFLYSSSSEGIHFDQIFRRRINSNKNPRKLWDCPTTGISASYSNLAAATGPEGLFKVQLYGENGQHHLIGVPQQLTEENCIHCNWLDTNIYGSSHRGRSCFAGLNIESNNEGRRTRLTRDQFLLPDVDTRPNDTLDRLHSRNRLNPHENLYSDSIFNDLGYSWGSKDKLYLAHKNSIKTVKVQTQTMRRALQFHRINDVLVELPFGEVVSGAVTPFGTIVECDEGISLFKSNGERVDFPGEPVRYRTFNRSTHYENQLHIIYEDRLEIFSFNEDYFVNQRSKIFGYTAYI